MQKPVPDRLKKALKAARWIFANGGNAEAAGEQQRRRERAPSNSSSFYVPPASVSMDESSSNESIDYRAIPRVEDSSTGIVVFDISHLGHSWPPTPPLIPDDANSILSTPTTSSGESIPPLLPISCSPSPKRSRPLPPIPTTPHPYSIAQSPRVIRALPKPVAPSGGHQLQRSPQRLHISTDVTRPSLEDVDRGDSEDSPILIPTAVAFRPRVVVDNADGLPPGGDAEGAIDWFVLEEALGVRQGSPYSALDRASLLVDRVKQFDG